MTTPDVIVDTLLSLDSLSDLPRTGWRLRGVRPGESIADHCFGVALVTAMLVDALRAEGESVDGERAMRMALVHDAPESATGDIPMPIKTDELARAVGDVERRLASTMLPASWAALWEEAERGETLEARVVKAADKIQMMTKALAYGQQGRGHLEDFWRNPKNARDMGLPIARAVYERIYERAGRVIPT